VIAERDQASAPAGARRAADDSHPDAVRLGDKVKMFTDVACSAAW
jgi:hypothetical protein